MRSSGACYPAIRLVRRKHPGPPSGDGSVGGRAGTALPDQRLRTPAVRAVAADAHDRVAKGRGSRLRWSDVDLAAGSIAVRSTRVAVDFEVVVSEPTTAKGRRSVALDGLSAGALRAHRKAQLAERLRAGPLWHDTGFVFVREDGLPYHPERITTMFKRNVAAAGLPPIRLHDLRHTAATLALAAGVHPKIVQERLGHSSINITLDTYSHVVQGLQHDAAEKVAGLLVN